MSDGMPEYDDEEEGGEPVIISSLADKLLEVIAQRDRLRDVLRRVVEADAQYPSDHLADVIDEARKAMEGTK